MMKVFISVFSFFIIYHCQSQPFGNTQIHKDNNSLLWEISGNHLSKPSYLFGTFHLMCKEDILFSENLKAAIKYAQSLYLEMDMDDPSNTFGALMYMNMKDGITLKDLYSIENYKKAERFFKDSLHTGLEMFQKMKPEFLSTLLYPMMMPCKSMDGVEAELMKLIKADKKQINGLETIAFQASIFDSIPYEMQANSLLNMIDSIAEFKIRFINMLNIYKSQHLDEIENSFNEEPGFNDQREWLLDNRNKAWVEKLKIIMKEENIFIAVGAGHLVGEKGLVYLLRKEGYTLKPVNNN